MAYSAYPARLAIAVLATSTLTGCIANSSNPVVNAKHATMNDQNASVTLDLSNPGGRRLTIRTISYELSHGDIAFPVAQSEWTGTVELPAGGTAEITLDIPFDTEPIEDDSTLLQLSGSLAHKDHTGFLGLSFMDLGETAFHIDIEAERAEQ